MYANASYLLPSSEDSRVSRFEIPWKQGEDLATSRPWYKWYRQGIDEISGVPVGDSVSITPFAYWEADSMRNSLNGQYSSTISTPIVGSSGEILYTYLSPVHQSSLAAPFGVVSVGMSMRSLGSRLDLYNPLGGAIYLTKTDGRLVAQSGGFVQENIDLPNITQGLSFAAQSNNIIVAAAAEYLHSHLPDIITLQNDSFAANVDLRGTRYMIDSLPIHLSEETLVYVVVIPHNYIWNATEKRSHTMLAVLVALATCMGLVGCFFVVLLTKGVSNEMRLRAALIRQLEETKSAETRSSHKSLVFANMSHDLRTPLAAILGLIDLCLSDVMECSELETNLLQMKSCASNLLGILNTILDMSKIEAGKMSLQESEFDIVNALEEVVDTFAVLGFKKGVEVALDLSDGSVEKIPCVIGDVGRVKQIMANLLSNGVKFTSEGHVILKAWVKPLSVSTERHPFNYKGRFLSWPWSQLLKSPSRNKEFCKLINRLSEHANAHHDYVQIEFEVDDTGRGIPKERWKSVFENFVQIEASGPRNYDGTGLGLGIVRSMVRLMGGDISIIDKDEPGEPGTRFHFNLIFKCHKQKLASGDEKFPKQDILLEDRSSLEATFGINSTSASSCWRIDPSSIPGVLADSGFMSPLAMEGVHVLLAMQGQGSRKIAKRWMERRGLQVWTISDWEEFAPTVEQIKQEILSESLHHSGKIEPLSPEGHIYDSWIDDFDTKSVGRSRTNIDTSFHQPPPSGAGSPMHVVPMHVLNVNRTRAYLLVIMDITMFPSVSEGLCVDMEDILQEAEKQIPYRIVWLVNPNTPSFDIQFLRNQRNICSLILHKPLYASRLQRVWQLLEELVGNRMEEYKSEVPFMSPQQGHDILHLDASNTLYTSLSCMNTFRGKISPKSKIYVHNSKSSESDHHADIGTLSRLRVEVGQQDDSCYHITENCPTLKVDQGRQLSIETSMEQPKLQSTPDRKFLKTRRQNKAISSDFQHNLSSMHILVAEDNLILQRLTKTQLVRLGATVECVDNGAEAVRLVIEGLSRNIVCTSHNEAIQEGEHMDSSNAKKYRSFDLVVMDCEMPVLNGYEATQRIRSEESRYGIRTPVIALTAHAMAQDEKKCIEAGMDFYLTKPLAMDALCDVVNKIVRARKSEHN
ncbi:hypothetical protein KP509_13G087900 [Ceratopteris richardii]|nr:hypothetical protein KP509_13G087900 [Ceratopteris richardii]